jgi:hypothetical protein
VRGPDYGAYGAPGSQIYGTGTEAEDSDDLSGYVDNGEGEVDARICKRKRLTDCSTKGRATEADGIR